MEDAGGGCIQRISMWIQIDSEKWKKIMFGTFGSWVQRKQRLLRHSPSRVRSASVQLLAKASPRLGHKNQGPAGRTKALTCVLRAAMFSPSVFFSFCFCFAHHDHVSGYKTLELICKFFSALQLCTIRRGDDR